VHLIRRSLKYVPRRELADVAVSDPHAATPTQPLADALIDADVVIVATNHTAFAGPQTLRQILELASDDCLIVDPWNCLGTAQVFLYAAEAPSLLEPTATLPATRQRPSRTSSSPM